MKPDYTNTQYLLTYLAAQFRRSIRLSMRKRENRTDKYGTAGGRPLLTTQTHDAGRKHMRCFHDYASKIFGKKCQ